MSNDHGRSGKFIIEPESTTNTYNLHETCYVSHKDELYFYGGLQNTRQISKLNCDQLVHKRNLNFEFVGGRCASNNNYILLCFPKDNKRLCYKSNSPAPTKWWEWFTYVDLAYASHDSFALSPGKRFVEIFKKNDTYLLIFFAIFKATVVSYLLIVRSKLAHISFFMNHVSGL